MKVIPLFQHTAKADSNEFAFAFESAKDGSTNTLSNSVIVVEDEKRKPHNALASYSAHADTFNVVDARSLQAALINHEVSKRLRFHPCFIFFRYGCSQQIRYKMGGLSIKVDDPLKNKMKVMFSKV